MQCDSIYMKARCRTCLVFFNSNVHSMFECIGFANELRALSSFERLSMIVLLDEERTCSNVGWSVADIKAMQFSILCCLPEQSVRECMQPNNLSITQLSNISFEDGSKALRTHFKNSWLNRRRFTDITRFALTLSDCVFLCNRTNATRAI